MSRIVLLGLVLVLFVMVLVALVALGLFLYRGLTRRPVRAHREWRLGAADPRRGRRDGLPWPHWPRSGSAPTESGRCLRPAAFGLCVLLATALGETVVRPTPPRGSPLGLAVHRAGCATTAHGSPPGLVAAMLVVSVATMLFTTLTASYDEGTDGYGRQVSCSTTDLASSRGPYPGSYYTLPLAMVLLVVLLVAGVAARQVVQRPRGMAQSDLDDDALRRRSLDVIVSATGLAVSAPLVGVALFAGSGLPA